ncbi:hypothetical protein B0H19DRAFT_1375030 [Mycena capillaripes]|nr:hypothetical protein B0H19DRAFT_1375030 [Mycena capillaripes]
MSQCAAVSLPIDAITPPPPRNPACDQREDDAQHHRLPQATTDVPLHRSYTHPHLTPPLDPTPGMLHAPPPACAAPAAALLFRCHPALRLPAHRSHIYQPDPRVSTHKPSPFTTHACSASAALIASLPAVTARRRPHKADSLRKRTRCDDRLRAGSSAWTMCLRSVPSVTPHAAMVRDTAVAAINAASAIQDRDTLDAHGSPEFQLSEILAAFQGSTPAASAGAGPGPRRNTVRMLDLQIWARYYSSSLFGSPFPFHRSCFRITFALSDGNVFMFCNPLPMPVFDDVAQFKGPPFRVRITNLGPRRVRVR